MSGALDLALPALVLTGNPVDGLSFYGPFEDALAAGDWAEAGLSGHEWWIATLVPVEQEPAERGDVIGLPAGLVQRVAAVLTTPGIASAAETRRLIQELVGQRP